MKNLYILVIMSLLGASVANSQLESITAKPDAKAEQELRKLEREWLDADVAAIERIEADDFIITYGDGSVRNKAQYIEMVRRSNKNPNASQWTEDSKVRIYGDVAVIVGTYIYKLRDKEKETVSESRYTDTYIKRNGRWQVVASHLSDLRKK